MAEKFSVLDILEAKYIQSFEVRGIEPENFYMNEEMLHILYKEIMESIIGLELSWEDAKKHGLQYRGKYVLISQSLHLCEVLAI